MPVTYAVDVNPVVYSPVMILVLLLVSTTVSVLLEVPNEVVVSNAVVLSITVLVANEVTPTVAVDCDLAVNTEVKVPPVAVWYAVLNTVDVLNKVVVNRLVDARAAVDLLV